ncbi:DinB family protein [Paenibacillus radicibacter]|uniref:DinB family protein n=1 Tax=Paenibacillus radicibacter TaxID=2972488 RepID=UPI00358F4604
MKEAITENENKQTIWSIVNHLVSCNENWLERFKAGEIVLNNAINNDETFSLTPDHLNDFGWRNTLTRLEIVFSDWRTVLEEMKKILQQLPEYFNAPWWEVVSNLSIHNAYHIGQIMLLKKQIRANEGSFEYTVSMLRATPLCSLDVVSREVMVYNILDD